MTLTIEERLRRAIGYAAVIQQATAHGTDGDAPAGFSSGLFDVADQLRTDLLAIERALPAAAKSLDTSESLHAV